MTRARVALLVASVAALTAARAVPANASRPLDIKSVRIVDATYHDVLGVVPLGRTVHVHVTLTNGSSSGETNVSARLASPAFNVSVGTAQYGALVAGSTAERTFLITPASCPPHAPFVSLVMSSSRGRTSSGFFLPVSCSENVLVGSLIAKGHAQTASAVAVFFLLLLALRFSAREPVLRLLRRFLSAPAPPDGW